MACWTRFSRATATVAATEAAVEARRLVPPPPPATVLPRLLRAAGRRCCASRCSPGGSGRAPPPARLLSPSCFEWRGAAGGLRRRSMRPPDRRWRPDLAKATNCAGAGERKCGSVCRRRKRACNCVFDRGCAAGWRRTACMSSPVCCGLHPPPRRSGHLPQLWGGVLQGPWRLGLAVPGMQLLQGAINAQVAAAAARQKD